MSTSLTTTIRALRRAGVTLTVLLALAGATTALAQPPATPDAPSATKPDTRQRAKPDAPRAPKPDASPSKSDGPPATKSGTPPASDAPSRPAPDASSPATVDAFLDPERVMASLNRALAWYRQARIVMRSIASMGVFARADEQTALRLLGRAFDAARAEAALLGREKSGAPGPERRRAEERTKLQASIRNGEADVERLRARLRVASVRERRGLELWTAVATNTLELDRARLEFITQMQEVDASLAGSEDDLDHQIAALRDSVPELRAADPLPTPAAALTNGAGTWALVQRLIGLRRSRSSLEELRQATLELGRGVDEDIKAVRATIRPINARLRALAKDPVEAGASLADGTRQFRELLERRKGLGAVILPLREQTALARRYASDLQGWKGAVDRETRQALQALGLDLVGVVIALAVVLIGGALWRIATLRYVTDATRRRLLLTARSVVVMVALGLVVVFHFTSEIAALVTVLGFAAAGIAFALQNVILAVAGYFTMVAPNGIRLGDQVSLQGPFGYVHGEVSEIGLTRVKLRELGGDPLQPTGRVVVFPNSVVFTGSFFKDPPGGFKEASSGPPGAAPGPSAVTPTE
jgi:hypothetical protein